MFFLSDILRFLDRGRAIPSDSEESGAGLLSPNCGFQSFLVGCFVGSSLRALSRPAKLKRLIDTAGADSSPYFEALGIVLAHELVRLNAGTLRIESLAKGGLAAWQQRVVTAYIEEHLAEQISLAALARLVGWSRCHRGLPQTTTKSALMLVGNCRASRVIANFPRSTKNVKSDILAALCRA